MTLLSTGTAYRAGWMGPLAAHLADGAPGSARGPPLEGRHRGGPAVPGVRHQRGRYPKNISPFLSSEFIWDKWDIWDKP